MGIINKLKALFGIQEYERSELNKKSYSGLKKINPNKLNAQQKIVYNTIFSEKLSLKESKEVYSYIDALDGRTNNGITNLGLRVFANKDNNVGSISNKDVAKIYETLGVNIEGADKISKKTDYELREDLKEIFPSGAKNIHIRQGRVGNCYFLASVSTISNKNPKILEQTVKKIDEGIYRVSFKGLENKSYIVTKGDTNVLDNALEISPLGVKLMGIAYGKFRKENGIKPSRSILKTLYGGNPFEATSIISGYHFGKINFSKNKKTFINDKIFSGNMGTFNGKIRMLKNGKKNITDPFVDMDEKKYYIIAGTGEKFASDREGFFNKLFDKLFGKKDKMVRKHAYEIRNITKNTVDIVNPYDNSNTTTITKKEFNMTFSSVYAIDTTCNKDSW